MLRKQGYQTKFLYSDEIYSRLLDRNSLLERIDREFDFSFINEEVKETYCEDNGRPSIPPVILYKATLIQRLKGFSDEEMERVAKYDIEIKHFLGIPIEDVSFDYSTLSVFRKRLGVKRFEGIFQKMLEQIKQKGLLDDYKTQIIDSMPVLTKAALPSTTALIYSSIKRCIKSLKDKKKEDVLGSLDLDEKKLEHLSKARPLFKLDGEGKKKAFGQAVKRAVSLIEKVKDLEEGQEELSFLKQIIHENVVFEDDLVKEKTAKPPRPIKSLVDKDARVGHKSEDEVLFGYKHSVSITENGFITASTTTTMADKDDGQITPLVEKQQEAGLKAEKIKADSAFGNPYNFVDADVMGIELEAPMRKSRLEEGFSWFDFILSNDKSCLTCPNGISTYCIGENKFVFPVRACKNCPLRGKCTTSRTNRTVVLPGEHELLRKILEKQKNSVKTGKSRLFVENIFAFLEKLGGKLCPYFSYKGATIHNVLVATLSNIIKCVRLKGG
ncbi:MAG: transposase [Candidatus Woesearchaeota archaeon]